MKKQLTPKTDAHFQTYIQTYAHMQPGNTHSTPCTKKMHTAQRH